MIDMKTLIRLGIEEAQKSDFYFHVSAIIYNKKQIISKAYNIPFGWKKHLHPKFKKYDTSIHAETAAIINARCDLKGASLFVLRINNSGNLRLAKPCEHCMQYITYVGIKKVIYTIDDNEFGIIKL